MIGNIPELYNYSSSKNEYTLYIPLQFWFCRNVSLSLPIIALEYSEVKINIEFSSIKRSYVFYINLENRSKKRKRKNII
jgi:hypothetical protein